MSLQQYWQTVGQWEEFTALACEPKSQRTQQEQEMKIGQMMASKYLKKEDVEPALMLTVSHFAEENVAQDNQPKDMKWVMYFEEMEKGMVMNTTNLQLAAIAFGTQETDDWQGRQIVAFHDPNVSFGGKLVGGIRVRAPRKSKPAPKEPDARPEPPPFDDDNPPF